ncbi:hypothetical protein AFLA_002635 [Aspergillus flavus NRRL3357]|nr:hypothetical protein AFLA_002635 [Aspergillus flavus NRRL3357]
MLRRSSLPAIPGRSGQGTHKIQSFALRFVFFVSEDYSVVVKEGSDKANHPRISLLRLSGSKVSSNQVTNLGYRPFIRLETIRAVPNPVTPGESRLQNSCTDSVFDGRRLKFPIRGAVVSQQPLYIIHGVFSRVAALISRRHIPCAHRRVYNIHRTCLI